MARIAGVDLPREKRVEIGLTYIFGIGLATSKQILAETEINPDTRVKDLSENDVSKLREYIEHHVKVEGDLRREVSLNIKRLVEIGCYRGNTCRLRGVPPPPHPARPRTEHQEQRAYPQGPQAHHRGQEEGHSLTRRKVC